MKLGFEIECLGFRVWGFGFRVYGGGGGGVRGLGYRVVARVEGKASGCAHQI